MVNEREKVTTAAEVLIFIVFMMTVFPFTLLGVGLSGGKVLSVSGMIKDLAAFSPAFLIRLTAWIVILLPPIWLVSFVYRRYRTR